MDENLGAVDADRRVALRCLFEDHSVPVDMLVTVSKLSPITINGLAHANNWRADASVRSLYRRFVGVLQSSIDDLETSDETGEQDAKSAIRNDARMKLLQNLSKTLETAMALDTRLRDSDTKEMDLSADAKEEGGSFSDLDEKLAALAKGLSKRSGSGARTQKSE